MNWKWLGLFKDWPRPWLASGGGGTSKDLETMSGEFWGRWIKTVRNELTRAHHFLMNSSLPVVFTSVSSFAILRSCQVRALEAVFGLYHHSPHLKNSCQFLRPQILLAHVASCLSSLPWAYFSINHLLPGLSQSPPSLPQRLSSQLLLTPLKYQTDWVAGGKPRSGPSARGG